MLATNLPVYFTSSSLCHRVALITNSMPLRSVTLRAIGAVDLVLWLFATSSSGSVMYHPSLKGLSCSSRNIFHPYHPNHARKVTEYAYHLSSILQIHLYHFLFCKSSCLASFQGVFLGLWLFPSSNTPLTVFSATSTRHHLFLSDLILLLI